jgi:hypothetical protein
VFESAQGWIDPVLVWLLPPPPPERITSPGSRLLAVSVTKPDGYQESNSGVVLAWARMNAGRWAMLFAWSGVRRINGERQASARWSWCWVGRREVYVREPVKEPNPWGMIWYGQRDVNLDAAVAEAVISLPEPMRAAAMRVVPRREMLRLESLNPFVPFTPRM